LSPEGRGRGTDRLLAADIRPFRARDSAIRRPARGASHRFPVLIGSRLSLRPRRPLYRSAGALVYPSLVLESLSVWGAHPFLESHSGSIAGFTTEWDCQRLASKSGCRWSTRNPREWERLAVNLPERTGLLALGIASLGGSVLASSRSSGHRVQMRIVSRSG